MMMGMMVMMTMRPIIEDDTDELHRRRHLGGDGNGYDGNDEDEAGHEHGDSEPY